MSDAPTKKDIAERLKMPSLAQAKSDAERALKEDDSPVDANDPRMSETYQFDVDIKGGGTRRYKGTFVNKILSLGEKKLVGIMRAKQCGGVPVESLTVETFEQITWSCWLTVSLKQMPKWFEDIDAIMDPIVFVKVAQEVELHEATFLRPIESGKSGA